MAQHKQREKCKWSSIIAEVIPRLCMDTQKPLSRMPSCACAVQHGVQKWYSLINGSAMWCFSCGKEEQSQLVYQVDIYCNIGTCRVSSSIRSQIPIQIESCRMFFITTSACSQVILQEVLPFLHKNVEWLGKPHYSTSVGPISEGWILSLKIKIATTSFQVCFKCFMACYFCHERFLISHVPKLTKKEPDFDLTATVVTGTPWVTVIQTP